MSNNSVKPAVRTSKAQFQTSENDRIPWKEEGKMATKFYGNAKACPKDPSTSGSHAYGDSELDMLKGKK